MKIEIRRKEEPGGDVYFQIFINDRYQESFYAGAITAADFKEKEQKALNAAKNVYDNMVAFASDQSKVTIIESTEI